jgi:hypothetical protein
MVRPLLPQLVSVTETLYPEVKRWGLESYFGSDLKWRMFRGDMDRATVVAAMSRNAESDSDQELPSEVQFDHQVIRRSRGTVQHDSLEWTKHHESFSQIHYTLALASHKRWPLLPTQHEVDTEALQAKSSGRSSFLSELYVRRGLWNLQLDLTPGPSDDPFDPP